MPKGTPQKMGSFSDAEDKSAAPQGEQKQGGEKRLCQILDQDEKLKENQQRKKRVNDIRRKKKRSRRLHLRGQNSAHGNDREKSK